MNARNPFGPQRESHVDRQIRLARESGSFDDLTGNGRPLQGIDDVDDEDWWIKEKVRREQVEFELPPTLAIRQAKRDLLASVPTFGDEADLRHRIDELNERIARVNRVATSGPPSTTTLIDVERTVQAWRDTRSL